MTIGQDGRERPILMSAPMVRALLREIDPKTQTRRTNGLPQDADSIEPSDDYPGEWVVWKDGERQASILCPYGVPGDRLWVRETCGTGGYFPYPWAYRADGVEYPGERWTPAIHMPRRASRITLEITDVRVQRLQDITQADCRAEGCPGEQGATPREQFREVWQAINGGDARTDNPWVWALTFKRLTP